MNPLFGFSTFLFSGNKGLGWVAKPTFSGLLGIASCTETASSHSVCAGWGGFTSFFQTCVSGSAHAPVNYTEQHPCCHNLTPCFSSLSLFVNQNLFFFFSNRRRWKNQSQSPDYFLVLLLFWVSNVDFIPSPSFSFSQLYKHLTKNAMGTGCGWKRRCRGMRCLQKPSQEAKNSHAPVSPGMPHKHPDLVHTCPRGMWFKGNSNRNRTPLEKEPVDWTL